MDFSTMNIWCWLVPIFVGPICAYLGYLLGKGNTKTRLKSLEERNAKLQADLDACSDKLSPKTATPVSMAPNIATFTFDAGAAKAIFGKTIKQDDLKVIEGIGPKIEGMFKNAGIQTWKALSATSVAECQKILDSGGDRYRIHDPSSWPMQAKMCYEGKWKALYRWQKEHDHGKL